MLDFEFSLPTKVIFGKKAEERVPELIKENGFHKVLLHSYKEEAAAAIPIYQKVKGLLEKNGIAFVELLGAEPNPTLGLIGKGIELCRKERVDFILAVGGGSVIDSAKGIGLGIHTSLEDVWSFVEGSKIPKISETVKVGAVLTAAAAGSETSTAAVITNEKKNLKRGAHHEANRLLFTIMNPEITYTVPKFQTACGIYDSIMHVFERYFTQTENSPLTDRMAEAIMKSIIGAGYEVMKNLNDYEARATLMWGASLAHNNLLSCGRLKGSGIHLIEEEMHSANAQIVHGAGLAVIYPSWARQVFLKKPFRFAQFACRVWNVEMDFEHPEKTALKGIEKMEEFREMLGLPGTLREIGVFPESFPLIVKQCCLNGRRISTLCDMTEQDVMEILERCKG